MHGDLFEFLRNDLFNATPYFAAVDPSTGNKVKSTLKRNQYGGTVGGPMLGVTLSKRGPRLVIEGDSVALGYLSEASDFRAHDAGRFVADDLVEIRDNGEVALIGRASDLINTAGKKVNPREVEQVILRHPAVVACAIYPLPSEMGEDEVAAAIQLEPRQSLEPVEILRHCEGQIAYFAIPRFVRFVSRMPLTENGKVKKGALREAGVTPDTWDRDAAGYRLRR